MPASSAASSPRSRASLIPHSAAQDPEMRAAYENIHDVMGDLASIHHWTALASLRATESEVAAAEE